MSKIITQKLKQCSVYECKTRDIRGSRKTTNTHGLFCYTHYNLKKKHGTPYYYNKYDKNIFIEHDDISYIIIKNNLGKVTGYTIIDSCKLPIVRQYKWGQTASGHIYNKYNKRFLHHLIFGKKVMIDHINRIPYDNRLCNLRNTTKQLNAANMMRKNKSGYKGVCFIKRRAHLDKPFEARIKYNYKNIHLGYHTSAKNAAIEYNKKAIELFGEYALLNCIT